MLDRLILPSRVNQHWKYSGIDSPDHCADKKHFRTYSHDIDYRYNTRGFRDSEWPRVAELDQAIWCVGDSFTVGLGSPSSHTWPMVLQNLTGKRTINVSMDGASNDWISKQVAKISKEVNPKTIVILWSYVHRRERSIEISLNEVWKNFYSDIKDSDWPEITYSERNSLPTSIIEEIRDLHIPNNPFFSVDQHLQIDLVPGSENEICRAHYQDVALDSRMDLENFQECVNRVTALPTFTVHCAVPDFCPVEHHDNFIRVLSTADHWISPIKRLDLARDGHHFDHLTSLRFCDQVLALISQRDQLHAKTSPRS